MVARPLLRATLISHTFFSHFLTTSYNFVKSRPFACTFRVETALKTNEFHLKFNLNSSGDILLAAYRSQPSYLQVCTCTGLDIPDRKFFSRISRDVSRPLFLAFFVVFFNTVESTACVGFIQTYYSNFYVPNNVITNCSA